MLRVVIEYPPLYGGRATPPPRRGGQYFVWLSAPAPIWGAGHAPPRRGGQLWQGSGKAVVGLCVCVCVCVYVFLKYAYVCVCVCVFL